MLRSLTTSALGMAAQQLNVDNISNNLANVNTTGFKKSSIEFQDLLYETIETGGVDANNENLPPAQLQLGHGSRAIATFKTFSQGAITETGNPLDLAINGDGFFQVSMPDGSYGFARDGAFHINPDGFLVNSAGLRMGDGIAIPDGTASINVAQDGVVSVLMAGETQPEEVGQIELVRFMNSSGLESIGGNMYKETVASGAPTVSTPGEEGYGSVIQGYLETSNVDVVQEMINLIIAQRAYEINSKAVKTSEDLLSIANNLKR